jgi:hypothetical protein
MAVAGEDLLFESLTVEERGFVLGATLLGLGAEGAATLSEPSRCAAALAALTGFDREKKATRLGMLAREIGSPYPLGFDQLHRSWLQKLLALEPLDLIPALVAGGPPAAREAAGRLFTAWTADGPPPPGLRLPPELLAELRRLVFSCAPEVRATPVNPELALLLSLSGRSFLEELRRLGARSLGASLSGAPVEVTARAMAAVGHTLSADLRLAAETADQDERRRAELDVMAAASEPGSTVEDRLESTGFHALCRKIADESFAVRRALALRMPVRLGERLLANATEQKTEVMGGTQWVA